MGNNRCEGENQEFQVGCIEVEKLISHPGGDVNSAGEYMILELRSWLEM